VITSSIDAYEARINLLRLLDQVERGESVTITKHGRAVARLVPVGSRATPDPVITSRMTRHHTHNSVRDMIGKDWR
jgi:prevent-host-death family protein